MGSKPLEELDEFDAHILTDDAGDLTARHLISMPVEGTSVADAVSAMQEHKRGSVILMDGDTIAGIFTEHDVLELFATSDRPPKFVPIQDVITPSPVVLHDDDPVAVAIHQMVLKRFRHIPLVNADDSLKGVISGRDILIHLHSLLSAS